MKGFDKKVKVPESSSWLDHYETKYVKTKNGIAAYLRYKPKSSTTNNIPDKNNCVYERTEVTVLARENGYSLVMIEPGFGYWVTSSVLGDEY